MSNVTNKTIYTKTYKFVVSFLKNETEVNTEMRFGI